MVIKSHNGEEINIFEIKNKKILLSFHPLAWTSICAKQMKILEKRYDSFLKLNTISFGVSVDTEPSKKEWAKVLKIKKLQLLCDFWPHGELAKKFDIFLEKFGFSQRANILLDENKNIILKKVYPIKKLPNFDEIIDYIKKGGVKL
ncbi:MAG: redoxin domain-containing protein [Candidatus Goldbacteria bacterium]|nr:redoxin domain-containing protein [Candidatus Goldiibacteriota bacterium]